MLAGVLTCRRLTWWRIWRKLENRQENLYTVPENLYTDSRRICTRQQENLYTDTGEFVHG